MSVIWVFDLAYAALLMPRMLPDRHGRAGNINKLTGLIPDK
jgi:hypothetical protein